MAPNHFFRSPNPTPLDDESAAQLYLNAVFTLTISATFSLFILVFRTPFGSIVGPLAKCFLLLASIVFTWQELAVRGFLNNGSRNYTLPVAGAVVVLFAPLLMAWPLTNWLLVIPLASISLLGAGRMIRGLAYQPSATFACLLIATLLGAGYFTWVNSFDASHVLSPEYALIGRLNRDTLYHAAIASMTAQHGVVSTGLDGLPPLKYHFLSHLWIGLTAKWLEVPTIHAYYLVPQVVVMPLFFFAFITASQDLRKVKYSSTLLNLLIPMTLLILFDFGNWASYLTSESYLFGMVLFLFGLPVLVQLTLGGGSWPTYLFLIILGMLMVAAKVSVGAIWFAGLLYSVLRQPQIHWRSIVAFGLPVTAMLLLLTYSAILYRGSLGYVVREFSDPLLLLKRYPEVFAINIAAIGAFGATAALIYRRSETRERVVIQLFVVLCLASLVPAVTLGSSIRSATYYFIDIGAKVSIVFLAWAFQGLHLVREKNNVVAILVFTVAVSAWAFTPSKMSSWSHLWGLVDQLATEVWEGNQSGPDRKPRSIFGIVQSLTSVANDLNRTQGAQMLRALKREVGYGNSRVLIFVPPSNEKFWRLNTDCAASPLFVPALLAVPMLNGLPPDLKTCPVLNFQYGYGYDAYRTDAVSSEQSEVQLCAKARSLGYSSVFVFKSIEETRMLDCRQFWHQ